METNISYLLMLQKYINLSQKIQEQESVHYV